MSPCAAGLQLRSIGQCSIGQLDWPVRGWRLPVLTLEVLLFRDLRRVP